VKEHKHYFEKHFPVGAADYCFNLFEENDFIFKITRKRQSKLGDYSYNPIRGHQITVNENLNPFAFTITYLHEVAHYKVHVAHKRRKAPHGKEWKAYFRDLMIPILNNYIFPENILVNLQNYIQNPKASSCADINLLKSLRIYDQTETENLLSDLKDGDIFKLSGRVFKKLIKKRTRVLCEETATKRKFLISEAASIEILNND